MRHTPHIPGSSRQDRVWPPTIKRNPVGETTQWPNRPQREIHPWSVESFWGFWINHTNAERWESKMKGTARSTSSHLLPCQTPVLLKSCPRRPHRVHYLHYPVQQAQPTAVLPQTLRQFQPQGKQTAEAGWLVVWERAKWSLKATRDITVKWLTEFTATVSSQASASHSSLTPILDNL